MKHSINISIKSLAIVYVFIPVLPSTIYKSVHESTKMSFTLPTPWLCQRNSNPNWHNHIRKFVIRLTLASTSKWNIIKLVFVAVFDYLQHPQQVLYAVHSWMYQDRVSVQFTQYQIIWCTNINTRNVLNTERCVFCVLLFSIWSIMYDWLNIKHHSQGYSTWTNTRLSHISLSLNFDGGAGSNRYGRPLPARLPHNPLSDSVGARVSITWNMKFYIYAY